MNRFQIKFLHIVIQTKCAIFKSYADENTRIIFQDKIINNFVTFLKKLIN